mmetsp:Transcript_3268/g.11031  ORF Transcript_3268/g.11031 Transcript_3268/m.11031 type:complete len:205 (-) Transcript_3268:272-886(-)
MRASLAPRATPAAVPPEPQAKTMWSMQPRRGASSSSCRLSSSTASRYPQVPSALEPPTGITYGLRPCAASRPASAAVSTACPRVAYSPMVTRCSVAPSMRSSNRLPTRPGSPSTSPAGHRRIRWGSSPTSRAAAAVARQWLDWIPPMVMTQSQPAASASRIRNSSLRTLFPESSRPVMSSRLITQRTPSSCSSGHAHGISGVGM